MRQRHFGASVGKLGSVLGLLGALDQAGCAASVPEAAPAHRTGGAHRFLSDQPGDPAHNLLKQRDFEDGSMLPWMYGFYGSATGEASIRDGALCADLQTPGEERWDAQVRHREMVIEQGHAYVVSFRAWSSRATKMTLKVGMMGAPYTDYLARPIDLGPNKEQYAFQFEMTHPDEPTAELAFHFGGRMVQGDGPITLCFDDIVLSDPEFQPPPPAPVSVLPRVRVNQLGYVPQWPKIATVVTTSSQPEAFELRDSAGKALFRGQTSPFGKDTDSGDEVALADFSTFQSPGKDLVLVVGDAESDPFDIDAGLYHQLKYHAFKYFYHNRSGIEIALPFADQEQWTRPAGHPKDLAKCAPDAGCDYSLDVSRGWYDAGDHGKYVVNGGISVWTLMNWQERVTALGGDAKALGDVPGLIPESGNGVADVLDEARWEMEFLLSMQVPEGKPDAGMVHHKMHDDQWTELATPPHLDEKTRYLRPVSTAATLNLAATAAQAARLFSQADPEFAARCKAAATRAWQAALANPERLAPSTDSTGGGPYDDQEVADEFYWAAAELFVTTGEAAYKKALSDSAHDERIEASGFTAMTWQRVDALGKITLATVPSKLSAQERNRYREQLIGVAKQFESLVLAQGYRLPFGAGPDGYPWGSNSSVVNNALILALAYDFTHERKFLDAVVLGMDYLLGRNAMGQSYVSGYGERPLQNPHHRFWAKQAHPRFPPPYPGALCGGPNSGLQDPYVKAAGLQGCAPQKCYVDHIEAWSANEITINWNAPLTWVAAWLDERAGHP